MQVEINNKDSIMLPLLGHVIFGTDEICDVVFENTSDTPQKNCSIVYDKNVCIIEVFNNNANITINEVPINEMAIIHPGDTITIDDNILNIIDENKLPKDCSIPFKLSKQEDINDQLVTSVSGLRSFNQNTAGELSIVGDKNSFTYKPINEDDIPFSVSYLDNNLTVLCKKDKKIKINGMKADYAILRNGDYITTKYAKYCVESPGTSSFSKYSPSHPRNIQLSEEYHTDEQDKDISLESNSFIKNNLWWITLLAGLIIIAIILFVLKNN